MSISSDPTEALAALEHFVVDNDDLLELEARIGRFNIFDALGIARAEIRHSNFLAWLLDPGESHGQGALFLKAVLMDLLRQSPPDRRPFSPVQLDGEDLRGVEIRREWRNIDLLIICEEPRFVIAIENKIDSSEHGKQLQRYEQTVHAAFSDVPRQFVYLTRDGDDASDEHWVPYSYADIYRVVKRARDASAGGIGDDVLAFLDHYLNLIGTRFMDDPQIDELCQRIYKNHRQALELIYERVGGQQRNIAAAAAEIVRSELPDLSVLRLTRIGVKLVPNGLPKVLPPVGGQRSRPSGWVWLMLRVRDQGVRLILRVGRTKDQDIRARVIERLIADPDEFGLSFKGVIKQHRHIDLCNDFVLKRKPDEDDEVAMLQDELRKQLKTIATRFAGVPDALRPIVAEWEAKRARSSV